MKRPARTEVRTPTRAAAAPAAVFAHWFAPSTPRRSTVAIAEYTESIRQGAILPPMVTYFDGVDFWLADGFHRYHAYRAAGVDEVSAEVRTGSTRDAVLFSVGANAAHGLRRTNADKRRAVETLLADGEWAAWSDREIARRCCVQHDMVAVARKSLAESASEKPAERTYTTKRGTTATMNTAKACGVSNHLVADVKTPLTWNSPSTAARVYLETVTR